MSQNIPTKFAFYFFACAEAHLVFAYYTCKRVLTHSDLENSCFGIAVFKAGKKKPTPLVDPLSVFAETKIHDELRDCLMEARERSDDHPSLVFPSQPLSAHLDRKIRPEDRCVYGPDFEHRINEAAKLIKHDAIRLAERRHAESLIQQHGD